MKKFIFCVLTALAVIHLSLVSCGKSDDEIKKNDIENNSGGNNNDEGGIDAPQELFGAWQMSDEQEPGLYFIYVFNTDGTGKIYSGCNPTDNTARKVSSFVYTYNRQNATLTMERTDYTIAFKNANTKLNFSYNGHVVMEFYKFDGELPKTGQIPSIPTNISAIVEGNSISVSWQSVSGANSYNVYRSTSAEGGYSLIGTSTSTSYKDNSPISGYNYYKVSAVNEHGTSSLSSYASCNYASSGNELSSPSGLQAQVNGTSVTITWQSVNNATNYFIYRSSNASSSYTRIGTSYSTSYIDYNPISGYNYYKVSAVNSNGESPQSSYASCNYEGGGSSTPPSAPTGVTATNQGSSALPSILISWYSVNNATSYKVYRSSSASGSYSQIGSSTSDTYMYDNSPLSGNNYYKVKAVNSAGESSYSSYAFYDNNFEYSPCPPTVKVSGTTSQTVTWTNPTSTGCGKPISYEVYKCNPYTGSYELKKTTSSTSYSVPSSDIHPGMNLYGIKAINNSGADVGVAYSQEAPLAKPSSFTAQKSGTNLKFTWSKVAWATGYQIFESSSANGTYGVQFWVDDGNQTSLTLDLINEYPLLNSGTTRYYKIRAIHESKMISFWYSDLTTYKSVKF